jgi:hypothetical protein
MEHRFLVFPLFSVPRVATERRRAAKLWHVALRPELGRCLILGAYSALSVARSLQKNPRFRLGAGVGGEGCMDRFGLRKRVLLHSLVFSFFFSVGARAEGIGILFWPSCATSACAGRISIFDDRVFSVGDSEPESRETSRWVDWQAENLAEREQWIRRCEANRGRRYSEFKACFHRHRLQWLEQKRQEETRERSRARVKPWIPNPAMPF